MSLGQGVVQLNSLACWWKSPCWNPFTKKITVHHDSLWINGQGGIGCDFYFISSPEMLSDRVWLHFIQKLPQKLAGGAVIFSVRWWGSCKPACSTQTHTAQAVRQVIALLQEQITVIKGGASRGNIHKPPAADLQPACINLQWADRCEMCQSRDKLKLTWSTHLCNSTKN